MAGNIRFYRNLCRDISAAQTVPGVMVSAQIVKPDFRMGGDHRENRIFREGRDRVPVEQIPCDKNRLHAVFTGVVRQPGKIAQEFVPPPFGTVAVQMCLQSGIKVQVRTVDQFHEYLHAANRCGPF